MQAHVAGMLPVLLVKRARIRFCLSLRIIHPHRHPAPHLEPPKRPQELAPVLLQLEGHPAGLLGRPV